MGCANSPLTSVACQSHASAVKPRFAIERFAWQPKRSRQSIDARRKPILKVPDRVVAPPVILIDIGGTDYKSMHASPKLFSPCHVTRQVSGNSADIDDIDHPPNYETQTEYISTLVTFMRDVNVNPELLQRRIRKRRTAMSGDTDDEDDVDIPWELHEQGQVRSHPGSTSFQYESTNCGCDLAATLVQYESTATGSSSCQYESTTSGGDSARR